MEEHNTDPLNGSRSSSLDLEHEREVLRCQPYMQEIEDELQIQGEKTPDWREADDRGDGRDQSTRTNVESQASSGLNLSSLQKEMLRSLEQRRSPTDETARRRVHPVDEGLYAPLTTRSLAFDADPLGTGDSPRVSLDLRCVAHTGEECNCRQCRCHASDLGCDFVWGLLPLPSCLKAPGRYVYDITTQS